MEKSIPRRVRTDHDTTDNKSKKADQQTPSLLSSLAPPPPTISEAPKKHKNINVPPRNKSPVPTVPVPAPQPPVISNTDQPAVKTPASKSLSKGETRTIQNLDKFIDVVASSIKKKKASSSSSVLDRINIGESGRRDAAKRGGNVDLFGSFLNNSSRLDFFTNDPHFSTPIIPPLPNTRIPIFPEDFPPNGPKEWPLSWWGIAEPSRELLETHERIAEELGYPIGKRKRGERDSPSSAKREEEKKSRMEESDLKEKSKSQRDRERPSGTRHGQYRDRDDRRRNDERRFGDGDRRSHDRRRS